MNPLASMFGNRHPQGSFNNPLGNAMNTMSQFQQFKQNFQGDPKQAVMNLLSSGRMSQEQFNQLSQMAHIFQNGMK